jgi:hypothetical protein
MSDSVAIGSSPIYKPSDLISTTNWLSPSTTGDFNCPTVILSKDPSPSNLRVLSSSSWIAF